MNDAAYTVEVGSSPRKRGCFCDIDRILKKYSGLPRVSGGVSEIIGGIVRVFLSSPRKRGCFRDARGGTRYTEVFPA